LILGIRNVVDVVRPAFGEPLMERLMVGLAF